MRTRLTKLREERKMSQATLASTVGIGQSAISKIERAKVIAPEVDTESWATLEQSPGLLTSDLPLTPAVVADLARLVMKHSPVRKR